MKYLNFSIDKFSEYQYTILITFLVIISLILNIKINKNIKIILLVLSLVICFFHPTLLIPFGSSLYVLYLVNRNKRIKNIKETFQNEIIIEDYYELVNYLNKPTKKIFNKEKFIKIYENNNFITFVENEDKVSDPIYVKKKYNFIFDLSNCYFFDLYKTEDYNLIFKLGEKYDSTKRIYNDLDFKNIFIDEESNVDKKRDSQIKLLKNKSLKKLGLLFYKNKYVDIDKFLNESIYNLGLYSVINDLYEAKKIDNSKYDLKFLKKILEKNDLKKNMFQVLKKKIKELVLLFFYNENKTFEVMNEGTTNEYKIEYFDFNKKYENKINIFRTFSKKYIIGINKNDLNYPTYKLIDDNLEYITNFILKEKTIINKDKKNKIINEKIDNNKSLKLFPKITNKNLVPNNNNKDLEQNIEYHFNELITNIENLDLLSLNFYNSVSRKERKKLLFTIHNNLSLFFCLKHKNLNKLLDKIYKNNDLNLMFKKIYENKSKLFQTQLENEKKIQEKYVFTDITDLYFDNLFYYFGLKYNDENILKIFPEEIDLDIDDEDENDLEETDEEIIEENPFVQLDELENKLDTYLSDKDKKVKQEELITKYYDLIDKDNYEKIKTLNSISEKREKELKLEELKFDKVIDDFGTEVYNIIDDVIELFTQKNETFKEGNSKTQIDKYTFFIYNLLIILTKENRILYTGFIFIVIAFFIYFISDEHKHNIYPNYNSSFLNKLL